MEFGSERVQADIPSCLILDVRLKGESGLEFQEWAAENEIVVPIIFMSERCRVRARLMMRRQDMDGERYGS
nr:hypothetical protein [Paraburkholderia hiiakae]